MKRAKQRRRLPESSAANQRLVDDLAGYDWVNAPAIVAWKYVVPSTHFVEGTTFTLRGIA